MRWSYILFFTTLTAFSTGWVFFRVPSSLGSLLFLIIRVLHLWKEYYQGKLLFWFHHIRGIWCLQDMYIASLMGLTLITWLKWCLPNFSTLKLFFSSFHILFFWSKSLKFSPHLREKEVSTYLIWNFSARKICVFPPLFIYLHISMWINIYLFYILSSNPVLCFHFVAYIVPTLTLAFAPYFYFLSASLSHCKILRLILYFLCPSCRISHFPKDMIPFIGEWFLEAKLWALGVLIVVVVPLFLGPLKVQNC